MVLPEAEILELAQQGVDAWIMKAREDHKELKMHFYGEGKDEFLDKVEGLETDAELDLRKRFAMSNTFLTDSLIRPFDNLWSAKGGTVSVDIPEGAVKENFKRVLKNVKNGLSDREYLKQVWQDKFITDPAGLTFVEVTPKGDKAYTCQKSITRIRKMKMNGVWPEYVMFEADDYHLDPEQDAKEKEKKATESFSLHWFVDDSKYYRLKVWDDTEKEAEILEEQTIDNQFEKVPGFSNSRIIDTNRNIMVSPIWKQSELLSKYLVNGSVKEIYQAKHGFPIFVMYANLRDVCSTCEGSGQTQSTQNRGNRGTTCGNCGGSGYTYKKDVSDVILMKPPTHKDDPVLPWVAKYVQPDLKTWGEMRTEQDWTWNLLCFSMWGTTIEKGENETATGRWIDTQPVNNRLNDFADIAEQTHRDLIGLFARFWVPHTFNGVSVNYSRRFMLETPDQIWKKYSAAKKDGTAEGQLDQLLIQYTEAEYNSNALLKDYYLKVQQIDPLPHNTLKELSKIDAPEVHKARSKYLRSWLQTKNMTEIILLSIDKAIEELDNFISDQSGATA